MTAKKTVEAPQEVVSRDVYIAKDSGSAEVNGQVLTFSKGVTRVRAGHPLLKGREHLFELLGVHYDVEQATAAPGETR